MLSVKEMIFELSIERYFQFISVQFSRSVVSDSLRPHESQHARPPGVHSDSRPSSQWCHPAISSSVVPFSSCPQSLPASESFPMSQLFPWGGQSTGASALASFLPKKSQGGSPSEWTGWISLQSKGLSRVFSNTTVQKHQFFGAQPSSQSNFHIHTWPQEKPQPWLDHFIIYLPILSSFMTGKKFMEEGNSQSMEVITYKNVTWRKGSYLVEGPLVLCSVSWCSPKPGESVWQSLTLCLCTQAWAPQQNHHELTQQQVRAPSP